MRAWIGLSYRPARLHRLATYVMYFSFRSGFAMLRNFLKQYVDGESMELKRLSANQFMEIWENYDKDGNLRHWQNT